MKLRKITMPQKKGSDTLDTPLKMPYNNEVINQTLMTANTEEFLTRCVVDTLGRKFYLYSSDGDERVVECETVDQFMNVLDVVRNQVDPDMLAYSQPF